MKKIFSIILALLFVDTAFGGQVGGSGGGTAKTFELTTRGLLPQKLERPVSIYEIGKVFTGAKNISRDSLGDEQLFNIDVKNRIVTFDVNREVLESSAVLPFDEVMKYADPATAEETETLLNDHAAAE